MTTPRPTWISDSAASGYYDAVSAAGGSVDDLQRPEASEPR
jgi:hypothetical protein